MRSKCHATTVTLCLIGWLLLIGTCVTPALAQNNANNNAKSNANHKTFTFAVSAYAGWMPWYFANQEKILKKWGDHYGINIAVKYLDYVPSVESYVAGQADAVALTNMETLDMPAAAGVDSSVVLLGDYSNGNDAILAHDTLTIRDLKGKKIYLAEGTVSQYLLS